jgi:integrase
MFKSILRYLWEKDGKKLRAYTHGIAGSLIAIAIEWVRVPDDVLQSLKKMRRKLGAVPFGLTEKNKRLLREFNDPRLLTDLLKLPDRVWRQARRQQTNLSRAFVEMQSALAIDLLLRAPMRMKNLSELTFDRHLYWPQGAGKPALLMISAEETKNKIPLEFEIPSELGDRLLIYRSEIVPRVTGKRPSAVFVTNKGKPRVQPSIALAITKTVRRNLGIKLTPHQFRHLAAKITLDANPGAFELVRELMGHKNMQTTTNFYAGIDTRRAGRAHSKLIDRLKDE